MPLSDDQRAMLRLLAQREQGYDDLAALMGLSVDEVRAKVVEALAQLEAEGVPRPTLPSERAAVAEAEVQAESAAEAPAPESPATPEEPAAERPVPQTPAAPEPPAPPAPAAGEPTPPAEPAPAAPAAKRTPPPRPKLSLPGSGGARAAIAAGATVLVLLVVILVVGGGDDSGESGGDSGDTTAVEEEGTNTNTAANNPDTTQAILQATDGSDAEGVASFGRVKNSLALQIEATGLEPSGNGESYTVWLAQSPEKMLPLATTTVGEEGKIGAQAEVPTEVLGYLANETFTKIVVTRTENAALQASLKKGTAAKQAPDYTGTEVLNGTVTGPIVGAAKKEEAGGE